MESRKSDLDGRLIRFGESLKRSEDYEEAGNKQVDKLLRTLQKQSKYSLASSYIGGSYGKNTEVIAPDLDIVTLINQQKPPMDNVIGEFLRILRNNEPALEIRPSSYTTTDISITFCFTNGISVDLLPAPNVKACEWDGVFKKMYEKEFARIYNPSRIRYQVSFMKTQDSFAHTLVRLSKLWFKETLGFGESFYGGSSLMELIGVAAAQKEVKQQLLYNENISASRAFRRVLGMVQNLKAIRLAFELKNDEWKRVPGPRITRNKFATGNKIPDYVGQREMLQRQCFIIDPANKFQDFLEGKESHLIEELIQFARITCGRLDRILNGKGKYPQDEFVRELFESPSQVHQVQAKVHPVPANFMVSYFHSYAGFAPKVIIRNQHIFKRKYYDVDGVIQGIQQKLSTVIHSTVNGSLGTVSGRSVEAAVLDFIVNNLQIRGNTVSSAKDHKQADVTLQIPFEINKVSSGDVKQKRSAIYVSIYWERK